METSFYRFIVSLAENSRNLGTLSSPAPRIARLVQPASILVLLTTPLLLAPSKVAHTPNINLGIYPSHRIQDYPLRISPETFPSVTHSSKHLLCL